MTEFSSRVTPLMEMSAVTQLPENTNCLACSEDGRYLGLGHSQGLSVWCSSSFTCVTEWLRDRLEITLIQMTKMDEKTYLLGTIDDMGVARVFALYSNDIHLLSVINVMEDINKRSICLTFDLYEGGRYGAASFSCNTAEWLEVLQFPLAAWLKELETTTSQKRDQNVSEEMGVKWSSVTVMNKINPPEVPAGRTGDSPLGVGRTSDYFTHCLALDAIRGISHQREKLSFRADTGKTKETPGSSRGCTSHFLLPCGQFSANSKADFQPGLPDAVAMWWTGSHNLLQYSLQNAPKNKPDMAPTPDVLWPNAKEIVCSAVSRCTRYIGLGLEDALVCIWDRRAGAPLSIVSVPAENSALLRIQLVDNRTTSVHKSLVFTAEPVQVLVLCKSGVIYMIAARQGAKSCTVQLTERPKDSSDLPTVIMSVPFLQAVMLVVQRNGKIFLKDVVDKTTVCFLTPPASHRIASPCNPVYALNAKQQVLYIRGDQETRCSSSNTSSQIQLFVFRFEQSEIIKQYVVSSPDSLPQQPTVCCDNLEEICKLYLQQSVLSVDERNKTLEQTWERLQETAATIQQRQQGPEYPN